MIVCEKNYPAALRKGRFYRLNLSFAVHIGDAHSSSRKSFAAVAAEVCVTACKDANRDRLQITQSERKPLQGKTHFLVCEEISFLRDKKQKTDTTARFIYRATVLLTTRRKRKNVTQASPTTLRKADVCTLRGLLLSEQQLLVC